MSKKILTTNIIPATAALAAAAIIGSPAAAYGKSTPVIVEGGEVPEEVKTPSKTKLKFKTEVLKLDALTFSHKHQARETIDKEAVAEYVEKDKEAVEKGADSPFPNLKAVRRNGEILVFSGFTRGAAHKKSGRTDVKVDVADHEEITDAEIFRLAVEANQEHGVRLTNKDKTHNLLRALKFPEYADLTNNALVPIVGASEFFIRSHRPASSSPAKRKNAKGQSVNTSRIGKKGGKAKTSKKAQKAADALAASKGGTVDEPDLGLDDTKSKAPSVDDDTSRALTRICTILDGKQGFTSKGIREAVESGSVKVSNKDLKVWAGTSDARVIRIAPLVVNLGWSPTKAFAHIDKEVESSTKVDHLINSAITTGGVSKRDATSFGEIVSDNKDFVVIVYDRKKFKVTVSEA